MATLEIFEAENKKSIRKLHIIDKHLPKPEKALRWVLLGPSGSGKSTLLKNIIFNRKWGYRDFYDEVYIFCKSKDDIIEFRELITNNMMKHKIKLVEDFNEGDLLELFESVEEDANDENKPLLNILMVFDDMILENGISHSTKKNTTMNELFMRGRHANISVVLSSQKLTWINQNMRRDNVNVMSIFHGVNKKDLEQVADDHSTQFNKDQILAMFRQFLKQKYDFINLDYTADNPFKNKEFKPIVLKQTNNN